MDLATCRILVVDDHDFQRNVALRLLRGLGVAELAEASGGAEALAMLDRDPVPDVIVCDLDMPGMDGVEFLRGVSERRLASAVVLVSAVDPVLLRSVATMTAAHGVQTLGVIEKPVTARRLSEALAFYRAAPAAVDGAGAGGSPERAEA